LPAEALAVWAAIAKRKLTATDYQVTVAEGLPSNYKLHGLKDFPVFQTLNGNHRREMMRYLKTLNPSKAGNVQFLARVYSEDLPAQTAWALASLANMEGSVIHVNTYWENIVATRQVCFF
jgi:hypothetical protein